MMTEIEVVDGVPVFSVVPHTGEALVLADCSTEQLAAVLDEVRVFEQDRLRQFKREVSEEILGRLDHAASWTLNLEGFKVTADAPGRVEYDMEQLYAALGSLVARGLVSEDAAEKATRVKIVSEPAAAGIKALKKIGGDVAAMIEDCERPTSKPRAVRVTRTAG